MELISIIMPTYNCGRYIEESIDSVLSQTYPHWQLIIVDDHSNDNTGSIIGKYSDKRIQYISNEKNVGAAISRNRALQEAKGKYIAFLDSDDVWEPTKLEKQISFMKENGYAFSYTNYQEIDDNSKMTGVIVSGPKHVTKMGMYTFCWPGCLTVMYDASKIGIIQIDDIKKNNDYAMWLQVCKKADCYLLDEILAKYRRGRTGSISNHSIITMIKWHYKLWHETEKKGIIPSLWFTGMNIIFGFYKKTHYVKQCSL